MAKKKFQELNLKDAFLFSAVLQNEEICKEVLEVILGEQIGKVSVNAEHTLFFYSEYRSIRLDIYVKEEASTDYNIEMQGQNRGNLPKRSRFHQAQMDMTALETGDDFNDLKPNIIIFICSFDPFGEGLYCYTFENRCREKDIPLGDGTKKIFLNTKGKNREQTSEQLINFLHYVENSTDECVRKTEDVFVKKLHHHVTALKQSREWERRYMTFEELLKYSKEDGREEGRAEGRAEGREEIRQQFVALIQKMNECGESELIPQLADKELYERMCKKYHL